MIGKELISSETLPLYKVKEILSERNKEGELSYEQQQAFDYSKKFAKVTPAKGDKLKEELEKIDGLSESFIAKVIDVLPADLETAKLISYKSDVELNDDQLNQVVETAKKYIKK